MIHSEHTCQRFWPGIGKHSNPRLCSMTGCTTLHCIVLGSGRYTYSRHTFPFFRIAPSHLFSDGGDGLQLTLFSTPAGGGRLLSIPYSLTGGGGMQKALLYTRGGQRRQGREGLQPFPLIASRFCDWIFWVHMMFLVEYDFYLY